MKLNDTELKLLEIAAAKPGLRLIDAVGPLGRSYQTARRIAAVLRNKSLIYPSRPTWLILVPGYEGLWLTWGTARQDALFLQAGAVLDKLVNEPGPVVKGAFLKKHNLEHCQKAVEALRDAGILYPWDSLVLTPQGEQLATKEMFALIPQRWHY